MYRNILTGHEFTEEELNVFFLENCKCCEDPIYQNIQTGQIYTCEQLVSIFPCIPVSGVTHTNDDHTNIVAGEYYYDLITFTGTQPILAAITVPVGDLSATQISPNQWEISGTSDEQPPISIQIKLANCGETLDEDPQVDLEYDITVN